MAVSNITHFFGDKKILNNVSLEITPGRVILLSGANGSGKTTLLKIAAGLLSPTIGQVKSLDLSFAGFHDDIFFPFLKGQENLDLFFQFKNRRLNQGHLRQLIERFPLLNTILKQETGNLSSGGKMLLQIVASLLTESQFFIFDEPLRHLSQENQILLSELVSSYSKDVGFLISHHQAPHFSGALKFKLDNGELKKDL